MVFLIQKVQIKDSKAIQIKLNELIAANEKASNRIVDIEDLTEKELDKLHRYCEKLSDLSEEDEEICILPTPSMPPKTTRNLKFVTKKFIMKLINKVKKWSLNFTFRSCTTDQFFNCVPKIFRF